LLAVVVVLVAVVVVVGDDDDGGEAVEAFSAVWLNDGANSSGCYHRHHHILFYPQCPVADGRTPTADSGWSFVFSPDFRPRSDSAQATTMTTTTTRRRRRRPFLRRPRSQVRAHYRLPAAFLAIPIARIGHTRFSTRAESSPASAGTADC